MDKVTNAFTPIRAAITPDGGILNPGDTVTIDTNVPATVLYTVDGSEPVKGSTGTKQGDAPVSIDLRVSARVRFKAADSRAGLSYNATKTQEATFDIARTNPVESLRDTAHFFRALVESIVDQNFYLTEGTWLVPVGSKPYTFVFLNQEAFPVRMRALHNGVDVFNIFPVVGPGQTKEIPIVATSGDNSIEIQTERAGSVALFDIGRFDIDVFA